MADRNIVKGNIGNALQSVAPDHILGVAADIFDEERQQYQSDINAAVGNYVENLEFVSVKLDKDGRIIEAIKKDGTKVLGAGVEVKGDAKISGDVEFNGASVKILENPEFAAIWFDNNNRILYGVQKDGNFYFGYGVPKQIVEYIQQKIEELSLDEYENIVAFLNGLEDGDKTLQDLFDEKVDKEEGKSLINKEYADSVDVIENPEFKQIILDSEQRIVEATYKDGTKLFGYNVNVNGNINVNGDITAKGANFISSDNPEFIAVWAVYNRIILAIQKDGNVYFGYGVPNQIKIYIEEEIGKIIGTEDITSIIDTLKEITDFLRGFESGSNLKEYLNSTYGRYEENVEYLDLKLDSTDKILEGTKKDGTKEVNKLSVKNNINLNGVEYKVTYNKEYIAAWVDNSGKIIFGFTVDGKVFIGDADFLDELARLTAIDFDAIDWDDLKVLDLKALKTITEQYCPEYLEVQIDIRNRIISGRKKDGTRFENIGFETPYIDINGNIVESFDDAEDRIQILKDKNKKIISYRDKEGVLYENAGIETKQLNTDKLNLSISGTSELIQDLKNAGFTGGAGDWSDESTLQIPEPRLAIVNLTNETNDATLPQSKGGDSRLIMQFWDLAGNYFKKKILLGVQGDTSTWMAKKNFGFDICNDDWEGDDTFGLKIGNWVEQDSFHIKAGANDAFHGMLAVMYKWVELAIQKLDTRPDRFAHEQNNQTTVAATDGSLDKDFGTGALCHPDGFPCIVYLNGEFYGIYSWQLKKHRANYFMDKKDYESIHLDGFVGPTFFGGNIVWTHPGIEIKNPKTLYCMDGTKYDDENGKELIDSTSPYYDSNNKDHKNTVKAKNTIIAMSQALSLVYAEEGTEAQKAKFEELFDKDAIETLYLMNSAMCNGDSVSKNTQWLKYKGHKIVPAFYDLDGALGHTITGQNIVGNIFGPTYSFNVENYPLKFVYDNYKDELDAKWAILRDSHIVSVETVKELLYNWINRIGYEFYKKENAKWPCPSYRKSYLNTDYWEYSGGSNYTIYNENTQYNVGDIVSMDGWEYATKYRCKVACIGEPPCTKVYEGHPISGGCFETPQRLLN